MKRRDFITLLGVAAAWPLAARAQQPATPVIGFLDARLSDTMGDRLRGFRQGLHESGYVEGDNVTLLYRWGENKRERLPELAAELVGRRVTLIIGSGVSPQYWLQKRQLRRSRSCSSSPKTRCGSDW
jgi:putative tryptophan/tyrosine transport system substrate-binding protein